MGNMISEEECKIDWIATKGKAPEKAGIYNKDNNLIRQIKYATGVHIEDYFRCKLSELYVTKRVEVFPIINKDNNKEELKEYISYNIKRNKDDIKCICFDHNCKNCVCF